MNTPFIMKYREDLTGVSPENLVQYEPFSVKADSSDAIITPKQGVFYTDSLKVYDIHKQELTVWWDYRPVYILPEATQYTGKTVSTLIQILNPDVILTGGYFTYQVVGGHWSRISEMLIDMLWGVINDNRGIYWENVLNKPSVFPPAYHTHNINRTYDWDVRSGLVSRITDDIIVRADDTRRQYLSEQFDMVRAYVDARYNEIVAWFNTHKHNRTAHNENAATIGIKSLNNIVTATNEEAIAGERIDARLTVGEMKNAIDNYAASNPDNNYIHNGLLPITRYGGLLYMEPSVQGSYEGSSQYSNEDAKVMIQEYDGTMVRIRPGTNGSSLGAYYDYCYNPFTADSPYFVRTNSLYWPASLGIWQPYLTRRSRHELIWGKAYNTEQYPSLTAKYFISLTNNTFDQRQHITAFLEGASYTLYGNRELSYFSHACIIGDHVYIFDFANWGNSYPLGIAVFRAPVENIVQGGTVTLEHLTGWTSRGGPYGDVTGDGVFVSPTSVSKDASLQPYIQLEDGLSTEFPRPGWNFYVEGDTPENIRVVFGGWLACNNNIGARATHFGLRVRLNVTDRTAEWVDSPQPLMYHNSTTTSPTLDQNPVTNITAIKLAFYDTGYITERGTYYINQLTGEYSKSEQVNETNSNNKMRYGVITNWVAGGENWDVANRVINARKNLGDATEFGSAVGNVLRYPLGLNNGYINLVSNDKNNTTKPVCVKYRGNEDYLYKILSVGEIYGYGPTTDRVETKRDLKYHYISYWNGTSLSVKGGVLSPWYSSGPSDIKENGEVEDTNQMTWSTTELNAAAAAFMDTTSYADTYADAKMDIVLHPDPEVPVFGILLAVIDTSSTVRRARIFIVKVNYTGPRTGNITGFTVNPEGYITLDLNVTNATTLGNAAVYEHPPSIYKSGNYLLMAFCGTTLFRIVGGQATRSCLCVYDLTNGTLELASWQSPSSYSNNLGFWPTILEDVGLVTMDVTASTNSSKTVLIVQPIGNTRDEFMAFKYSDKSKIFVLVAQEVTQGWIVYFTESQPVILNGREDTVPSMSIDLTTIKSNPANSTFYVYVVDDPDVGFTHVISTTSLTVSNSRAFIGTISTGPDKISSIDTTKATRIDKYQISTDNIGSGIPVSTGSYIDSGDWIIDTI